MIGIVILNYNTWEITCRCVKSIIETCNLDYKIYIVDNNSQNDSYNSLYKMYGSNCNVSLIKSNVNCGYAKGNNIGIDEAIKDGCEYVIVTNNDIIFCDSAIQKLTEFIESNKHVVIVGPKIIFQSGGIQKSSTMRMQTFLEYLRLKKISNNYKIDEENITEATKVYSVSGCCFIMRTKLFKEIGAFDEGTFLYNEENILSLQAYKSGYDTYFLPSAKVIHAHGATAGKQSMFINTEFLKSGFYYWRKYRCLNSFSLILMWIYFTFRWLIKSIYCKDLRTGWGNYLKSTINVLFSEINIKRNGN